jgi:hypothetical protein
MCSQPPNLALDTDAPCPSRPLQSKARAGLRRAGQLSRYTLQIGLRAFWALALATAAIDGRSQEIDPVDELRQICQTMLCYPPGAIQIRLEGGRVHEVDADYPYPIVHDDAVVLFPGSTVFIAADVSESSFQNLRAVEKPEALTDVFEFQMYQDESGATFLKATNYFQEPLKYRAAMMLPDGEDLYSTSSCPVHADGFVMFEHWQHPIFQLILVDFRVILESENVGCE